MANKEALRALQGRLAERLQEVRSIEHVSGWLAVECAGQALLFPLAEAGEIFQPGALLEVPHTEPWFLGVVALRGNIVGVVNIAPFLDAAPVDPVLRAQPEQPQARRLVVLNEALGLNVALRVEALEGLRGRDAFLRSGPPASSAPAYFGSVFTDPQGCIWHEVNLQALAQTPEFLDIAVHPDAGALAAA